MALRDGVKYGVGTYGTITLLFPNGINTCTVGNYCSIAGGVTAHLASNHHHEWVTTYPFSAFPNQWRPVQPTAKTATCKGNIIIGNDVWIGQNVTILSGVKIGDGAVIGTQAVVSKDVPPYAIVVGNPGRVVKYRFPAEVIKSLLKIAWWNWPKEKIQQALPLLESNRISEFIAKYGP